MVSETNEPQASLSAEPRPLLADVAPAPPAIQELADACVRFVERAVGVKLDYTAETLPLLDHYLASARDAALARPETVAVIVQTAGAYFGEVIRRRHASFWRTENVDPADYRIELEQVYLAVTPAELARQALLGSELEDDAMLELEDDDRDAVAERLAELPEVTEQEFYAPSTRLEVLDIAVEAIQARRLAADEPERHFGPEDYDPS